MVKPDAVEVDILDEVVRYCFRINSLLLLLLLLLLFDYAVITDNQSHNHLLYIPLQPSENNLSRMVSANRVLLLKQLDSKTIARYMLHHQAMDLPVYEGVITAPGSKRQNMRLLNAISENGSDHYSVFMKAIEIIQPSLYHYITVGEIEVLKGEEDAKLSQVEIATEHFRGKEMPRLILPLGQYRFIAIVRWNGQLRVDIRQYTAESPGIECGPTKAGVSLSLVRWQKLVDIAPDIMNAVQRLVADEEVKMMEHLGGNIHVSINSGIYAVDLRQWWLPQDCDSVKPTRKGIGLRLTEWETLMKQIDIINQSIPELSTVVPCYLQDDHNNQEGALQCVECNP